MVNDGRLELTPLRVEDAVDMVDVLFSPALYEYTGGEPPALDALRRQYAAQAEGGPADGSEQWLNWIVRQQGEPIGYVQATLSDGSDDAEIAWVIGLPWQGRGLAKAAAALLVRELARVACRASALTSTHGTRHRSASPHHWACTRQTRLSTVRFAGKEQPQPRLDCC